MFTAVFTKRDAKTELEIKGFQRSIAEKVALNHSKLVDWLAAHNKLDPINDNSNMLLTFFYDVKIKLHYVAPTVFSFRN